MLPIRCHILFVVCIHIAILSFSGCDEPGQAAKRPASTNIENIELNAGVGFEDFEDIDKYNAQNPDFIIKFDKIKAAGLGVSYSEFYAKVDKFASSRDEVSELELKRLVIANSPQDASPILLEDIAVIEKR